MVDIAAETATPTLNVITNWHKMAVGEKQ